MPGPAALIALAARLGIKKAATYTYKQLQKHIAKAQKKKTLNKQKLKKVIKEKDQRDKKKK